MCCVVDGLVCTDPVGSCVRDPVGLVCAVDHIVDDDDWRCVLLISNYRSLDMLNLVRTSASHHRNRNPPCLEGQALRGSASLSSAACSRQAG